MSEKIPKIITSNVRGVLLSNIKGVPLKNFLTEYEAVIKETLDLKKLGFRSTVDFLEAIPHVARIVKYSGGSTRVLGIALNEFNIVAEKSCYKGPQNEVNNHGKSRSNMRDKNKQPEISQPTIPIPKDCMGSANAYDFRASFMKENCPDFKVIKTDPAKDQTIKEVVETPPVVKHLPQSNKNQYLKSQSLNHAKEVGQPPQVKSEVNDQDGNNKDDKEMKLERFMKMRVEHQKNTSLFGATPKLMVSLSLGRMLKDTCPGKQLARRSDFSSMIDIMLTHVDLQHGNYFWGIIVNPYNEIINNIFLLDEFKDEFKTFSSGKRAVVKYQNYHSRAWVTSTEGGMASVFMIDFGNTEEMPVAELKSTPAHLWDCPPLAVPFRHELKKNFKLEGQVNERFRCTLKDDDHHIFTVESMNRI